MGEQKKDAKESFKTKETIKLIQDQLVVLLDLANQGNEVIKEIKDKMPNDLSDTECSCKAPDLIAAIHGEFERQKESIIKDICREIRKNDKERDELSLCKKNLMELCRQMGIDCEGEEDMASLIEKIKKVFGKGCNDYKELKKKYAEANTEISKLRYSVNDLNNRLRDAEYKNNNYNSSLKNEEVKCENKIKELQDQHKRKLEEKDEEYKNILSKLEKKEQECQDMISKHDLELQSQKSISDAEINKLNDTLTQVGNQLAEVQKENDASKQLINDKVNELAEKTASYENVKKELNSQLDEIKDVLDKQTEETKRISSELEKVRDSFKAYKDIYDLMLQCPSMKCAFEQMEISGSEQLSENEMVKFITFFSSDYGFARVVYNALEKSKAEEKEPLTNEEYKLVDAVNRYYGGTALDDLGMKDTQSMDFKRANMKDLSEPRRTDFYQAEGLYVPALRRKDDGTIDKKAIVKAR